MPDMSLFEEHIAVGKYDDCCGDDYDQSFNTLCCLSHRYFFLYKIDKEMEDDAGKHAAAILYINPGRNKAHRCNRN